VGEALTVYLEEANRVSYIILNLYLNILVVIRTRAVTLCTTARARSSVWDEE
jgi:hypothetical protein